ncbi:MAG: hypothetical protein E7034_08790 [Akkermansiaceae bacterium]|nr:hypothetical protein [Akkermansiaceae bacterium]
MTERKIKRGDIVTIKPEWLDPGEDGSMKYVVLEERGDDRILVQALGTGLPIAPMYVYDVAWVNYARSVPPEMYERKG